MKERLFCRKMYLNGAKTILLLFVVAIICSRCIRIPDEETLITLSVSTDSIHFTPLGDTFILGIKSNDRWYLNNNASWILVSKTFGLDNDTLTVTADANTGTTQRTSTITVSSSVLGVPEKKINITQENPVLSVSSTSLNFIASGEQKSFTVASNINWTISSGSSTWFTLSRTSGTGNNTVTVTAQANTSTSSRTGTITVSGSGITRTISFTQTGLTPTLSVSTNSLSFSSFSDQKSFAITSNTNWTVSSGTTWFTISTTSGTGNSTVFVTTQANISASSRTGTISVSISGITQTIYVTQSGSNNIAQVRFQKYGAYSDYTWMAIADISEITLYASYNFGTGYGTSPYYEVPSGTLTPLVWYATYYRWQHFFSKSDGTSVWTVNLVARHRYTILLYYDGTGTSYTMNITDNGTYSDLLSPIRDIPKETTNGSEGRSIHNSLNPQPKSIHY